MTSWRWASRRRARSRAAARLALQRLVGTAGRQWPLGRHAGNAALRRGARCATATSSPCAATSAGSSWTRRPSAVEATLWRPRAACAGRMAGQAGTQRPAILLDADLRPMRSFRQDYAWPEKREGWTVLSDDEAILLVDPAGRLSIPSLPQGRVTSRTAAPGSMPDLGRRRCGGRRGDGRSGGRHPRRHRRLAGRRQHLARRAAVPRTARKRNDRNAEQGAAADAAQARPREPDPAFRRRRRSIGCPIPPSRTRRRPWSSCPSLPRTCLRRGRPPCRSRRKPPMPRPWRWTRRRKQAMPWMPPSRKQQSREAAAAAAGRGRRCHRLGQPPGDPDPDLRRRRPAAAEPHAGGALARLQRDAGTAGQTAVGKRGRAAAAGNVVAG